MSCSSAMCRNGMVGSVRQEHNRACAFSIRIENACMKIRACLLALLVLAACAGSWAQDNTDAGAVFKKNCALCHGPDGRAQTPAGKNLKASDLTSPAVQSQSDAQIREALAKGKGKMPPYGPALGDKGLAAMVKYIRSLKAK